MKLTKFEHAALILEVSGHRLVIDPGSFTAALTETSETVAIVITHEHADHWTLDHLRRILAVNPGIPVFGPAGVAAAVAAAVSAAAEADQVSDTSRDGSSTRTPIVTVVQAGDTVVAGPFKLSFFGATHAVIHSSIPVVDNIGVLVNSQLYYAGDAFTVPDGISVDVLAVPAGAPWLKISDVIDYVLAIKPRRSFPAHEMLLSRAGKDLSNARIKAATEQVGGVFVPLEPGESLDF